MREIWEAFCEFLSEACCSLAIGKIAVWVILGIAAILAYCLTVFGDDAQPAPRVQMLCMGVPWCQPCRKAERDETTGYRPWLEKSGWLVSVVPWAQWRLVDCECETEIAAAFAVESYPTFVLCRDDKERKRWEGYPGRAVLLKAYLKEAGKAK